MSTMRAKLLIGIVLAILLVPVMLLLSGKRILISETKVNPGDHYFVSDYGDLGSSQQASLVCRYFTGRSFLVSVFWYSPNNVLGKDQCPFLAS